MVRKRIFRATLFALIAGLLLSLSSGLVAADDPYIPSGPPHAFYGDVLINGNPAPVGTKVEAVGTGVKTTALNPIYTDVAGKYGTSGATGDKLIVQGDDTLVDGTTLTFYIDDVSTEQTFIWQSGNETELHLSVTIPEVTLTFDVIGTGSVTEPASSPVTDIPYGDTVNLLAVETDDCWEFDGWTADTTPGFDAIDDPSDPDTFITMDADYSIHANFVLKTVTLNVDVDGVGGTVTEPASSPVTDIPCGNTVNLFADPDPLYLFNGWSADTTEGLAAINAAGDPDTFITMDDNYSIHANFVQITTFGGGGGLGAPPEITTNLFGSEDTFRISVTGRILDTITVTSPDGKLTITIPANTIARDSLGNPLSSLTVDVDPDPPCPVPEDESIIGLAYSFGPDGATFNPPIQITFAYDPDEIPEGVLEGELIIAFCDEDSGEWIQVPAVVDTDNNIITAEISHFTTYAIIGKGVVIVVPEKPEPAPEPSPPAPKPAPAVFSPKSMSVLPAEVNPGEMVEIRVIVTNTGGEGGTHDVILKVNSVKEDSKTISLNAGESKEVSFTISRDKPGTYQIESDGLSGSFVVKEAVVKPVTPTPTPAPEVTEEGIQWWIWVIIAAVVFAGVVAGLYFYGRRAKA